MLFEQYVEEGLGCASYLIGDEQAGEAIVVDPAYAVGQYLETAERKGVRITRVLETHTHADHVSGHGRLALEHGVPVAVHPAAEADYPFEALEDGAEIEVGQVSLRVSTRRATAPSTAASPSPIARGRLSPGSS